MEKIPDYDKRHAELNALKDCLHDLTWQLEDAKEQYNYRIKKLQEAGISEDVSSTMKEKYFARLSDDIDRVIEEINQAHLPFVDEVIWLCHPDVFID